jgi:exosortase/archaeosortase family protein
MVGALLSLFDPSIIVSNTTISGRFSMMIVKNCDAMEVKILLLSAITAFPASLRYKAVLLLLGLVALIAANIVRLSSLYVVGIYAPDAFDFLHYELWPLLLVFIAVALFLLSIRIMSSAPQQAVKGR